MSLYKFDPKSDITTHELALVVKAFLLVMHGETPDKNLELTGEHVDQLKKQNLNLGRHFKQVDDYD